MPSNRPHGPEWRNRIVGQGEEAPDQLLANPHNWRTHPEIQQDELSKVLQRVGWVQRVIVNKRTGHVLDGHLRVQLAMWHDEERVPVTYVDLSPSEEKLMLAVLDPIAALAMRDDEKLAVLTTDVVGEIPDLDLDLGAILHRERKTTKGLTREVNACLCCQKKCKPGCGCHRDKD